MKHPSWSPTCLTQTKGAFSRSLKLLRTWAERERLDMKNVLTEQIKLPGNKLKPLWYSFISMYYRKLLRLLSHSLSEKLMYQSFIH